MSKNLETHATKMYSLLDRSNLVQSFSERFPFVTQSLLSFFGRDEEGVLDFILSRGWIKSFLTRYDKVGNNNYTDEVSLSGFLRCIYDIAALLPLELAKDLNYPFPDEDNSNNHSDRNRNRNKNRAETGSKSDNEQNEDNGTESDAAEGFTPGN